MTPREAYEAAHQAIIAKRTRFFLGRDCSLHWYLVPAARRAEWEAWANIPEDDERSWTVPDFARAIDDYHTLTFAEPEV